MLKKIIAISSILATSSTLAFAQDYKGDYKNEIPAPQPCPIYQFEVGPYVGFSIGHRVNFTSTPVVYHGLDGTLSAGYATMLDPSWYLAGEIFGGNSAQLNNYESNTSASVRSTWTYGASIIPGYTITDHVLAYLRGGVVRTRFSDQGKSSTGGQLGLGAQTSLARNWDVRGEYVYSAYQSITGISKPQTVEFNVGLVYKFV